MVPQVEKAASASSGLGSLLPSQQITGRNDLAVGAGAQSPLDEDVQPGEVGHHLQAGLRDQEVGAMAGCTAARL